MFLFVVFCTLKQSRVQAWICSNLFFFFFFLFGVENNHDSIMDLHFACHHVIHVFLKSQEWRQPLKEERRGALRRKEGLVAVGRWERRGRSGDGEWL